MTKQVGQKAYERIKDLFPICRSITGESVRETLGYIKGVLPGLKLHEIASGIKVFDWTIPKEWNIREAYIATESGEKIVDFKNNNLHVVGYSTPVDTVLSLEDLQAHLHSLPGQPEAIPYVTSYYKERWGFCLSQHQRERLADGKYHVVIDSDLKKGVMNYADLVIKGKSSEEVLLSTYICHPSMANNELSGPAVAMALAEWLLSIQNDLHYSYRIVFAPETIGAIAYISKNLKVLQKNVVAGYVLTCMGDDRAYSFMPTPWGDSLADRLTTHVLNHHLESYQYYSFLDRGSDERQYCSPQVGLPVVSVMRSKYREYPEYHTSLDNLDLVSPAGLQGSFDILQKCIMALEANRTYLSTTPCEPMLSKRGLYFNDNQQDRTRQKLLFDLIAFCDGKHDLLAIAEKMNTDILTLTDICNLAQKHDLLRVV